MCQTAQRRLNAADNNRSSSVFFPDHVAVDDLEVADALNAGLAVKDITFVPGTVYRTAALDSVCDAVLYRRSRIASIPAFPYPPC